MKTETIVGVALIGYAATKFMGKKKPDSAPAEPAQADATPAQTGGAAGGYAAPMSTSAPSQQTFGTEETSDSSSPFAQPMANFTEIAPSESVRLKSQYSGISEQMPVKDQAQALKAAHSPVSRYSASKSFMNRSELKIV